VARLAWEQASQRFQQKLKNVRPEDVVKRVLSSPVPRFPRQVPLQAIQSRSLQGWRVPDNGGTFTAKRSTGELKKRKAWGISSERAGCLD
jgi:hypothetical protein